MSKPPPGEMKLPAARSRLVLAAAGSISAAIAILQFVVYFGGPAAYRTFGAPPHIAEMRGAEPVRMFFWSSFWFGLFATFALYAFSGAGLVRRLPALSPCLMTIGVSYGIRSLAIVPQLMFLDGFPVTRARDVAFSALSRLLALGYAIGARAVHRSARPTRSSSA